MQLSLPTPTVLLFLPLLLPFQTLIIAAPGPAPAPAALEARITVAVTIPNFSSGAVVQAPSGDTRIYYQTNDGAVHELGGIGGSPDTSRNSIYNDITLFRPGKARKGSPLAAINLDFNLKIRLYYISPDNKLQEYVYNSNSGTWSDGELNAANILVRPKSQYLWAVSYPTFLPVRVGYVSPDGSLSEVAFDGTSWKQYIF